ncbi:protein-disulfide reductase DsbD domain-containing protein [Pedobacter sp. UC225_61]|uniref:protein-disulfide reductase DsbD domain-containing protein n=1 Tax=Pedobacter sp. UC225_61 TaxID=3374623 RepID=UPI0037B30447
MKKLILMAIILMVGMAQVKAQIESPVKWSYLAKKGAGGMATLYIKATIESPWHIYSVNQKPGGPEKTAFTFTKSTGFALVGKVSEPKPVTKFEEVFGINVSYFENSVIFSQKIKLKAKQTVVKGKVSFMACNEKSCLPGDEVAFSIPVK